MRRPRVRDILLTAALNAATAPPQMFFYGGQAVIEGVLMRGRDHYAVAARRPDGSITVTSEMLNSRVNTNPMWARPFLRGVAGLYEMLALGMRALQWSANVQLGEEAELSAGTLRATVAVSMVFALVLFIGLPLLLGGVLHRGSQRSVVGVLIEGGIRAAILLGYLALIGRLRSVRRLFEYHGAEHKAINCLEFRRRRRRRPCASLEPAPSALRHRVPGGGGAGQRDRLRPPRRAAHPGPDRTADRAGSCGGGHLVRGDSRTCSHPPHNVRPSRVGAGAGHAATLDP